jgi:hypothetical protein
MDVYNCRCEEHDFLYIGVPQCNVHLVSFEELVCFLLGEATKLAVLERKPSPEFLVAVHDVEVVEKGGEVGVGNEEEEEVTDQILEVERETSDILQGGLG